MRCWQRLGIAPDDLLSLIIARRGYDARKPLGISLVYTVDVTCGTRPRVLARHAPAIAAIGPAPDTGYRFAGARAGRTRPRPSSSAPAPAACSPALVLAQMGFRPDHPRARQGRARAHQGHLGPVAQAACSTRNPTCSSAKAARARSPTASSTARSRTRSIYGRKVLTEFVKAGAPEEILYVSQAAHRHVPAGDDRREHARDDRSAGRRVSASAAGRRTWLIETEPTAAPACAA